MTRDEMAEIVVSSLEEFLDSEDREVTPIMDATDPIDQLGLDTADGVAWICDVEGKGLTIPDDFNPFRGGDNQRDGSFKHRTVGEIIDKLLEMQAGSPGEQE